MKNTKSATWTHPRLDLGWLRGGPLQNNWADAYALIWNVNPIFCAGALHVTNKEYFISTAGWRGMPKDDEKSLESYLQSMDLTPLLKETAS